MLGHEPLLLTFLNQLRNFIERVKILDRYFTWINRSFELLFDKRDELDHTEGIDDVAFKERI